jgi:hypothetical protein
MSGFNLISHRPFVPGQKAVHAGKKAVEQLGNIAEDVGRCVVKLSTITALTPKALFNKIVRGRQIHSPSELRRRAKEVDEIGNVFAQIGALQTLTRDQAADQLKRLEVEMNAARQVTFDLPPPEIKM